MVHQRDGAHFPAVYRHVYAQKAHGGAGFIEKTDAAGGIAFYVFFEFRVVGSRTAHGIVRVVRDAVIREEIYKRYVAVLRIVLKGGHIVRNARAGRGEPLRDLLALFDVYAEHAVEHILVFLRVMVDRVDRLLVEPVGEIVYKQQRAAYENDRKDGRDREDYLFKMLSYELVQCPPSFRKKLIM